jgi:hypothetical protein
MEGGQAQGVINVASGRNIANAELVEIFGQAGWALTLTGARSTSTAPVCATERLRSLGVAPRDIAQVLSAALARPDFFRG